MYRRGVLSELLLAGDCSSVYGWNFSEVQNIFSGQPLWGRYDGVTNTHIKMESRKRSHIKPRLDRIARATIGRSIEIGHWLTDAEVEAVLHITFGGIL